MSTNIINQNCALSTGQSVDSFYSRISKKFPSTNFLINSICDTNSNMSEALKKISMQFESTINNKFKISLIESDTVTSVIKTKFGAKIKLVEGKDYVVSKNIFSILNTQDSFEKIEVIINNQ